MFPLGILCFQVRTCVSIGHLVFSSENVCFHWVSCVYTEYLMFLLHILRVESASFLMAVIATKHNEYSQYVSVN